MSFSVIGMVTFLFLFPVFGTNSSKGIPDTNKADATTSPVTDSDGFNFDSVNVPSSNIEGVKPATSAFPLGAIALVSIMFLVILGAGIWGQKAAGEPARLSLGTLPLAIKLICTFVLVSYSATHILAAITAYMDTRIVYSSAEEYFRFLKPARLTALSHAHLMSIATMDGLVGTLFALSLRTSWFSTMTVTAAFTGILGDIGSWWLIKYYGSGYENIATVTGILFATAFTVMTLTLLYGLWLRSGRANSIPKGV